MERHLSALSLVDDVHLKPQHIAQLALEGGEIGVHRLACIPGAGAGDVMTRPFGIAGLRLCLANREPLFDHFLRQSLRVWRGRDGPRVPHTDIASH